MGPFSALVGGGLRAGMQTCISAILIVVVGGFRADVLKENACGTYYPHSIKAVSGGFRADYVCPNTSNNGRLKVITVSDGFRANYEGL